MPRLKKPADGSLGRANLQPFVVPEEFLSGFPNRFKSIFEPLYSGISCNYRWMTLCEDFLKRLQGPLSDI
jgi:hypothetical protein